MYTASQQHHSETASSPHRRHWSDKRSKEWRSSDEVFADGVPRERVTVLIKDMLLDDTLYSASFIYLVYTGVYISHHHHNLILWYPIILITPPKRAKVLTLSTAS